MFPNLWQIKSEFRSQWEANLQDCTAKMMMSLAEHYNRDIKELDVEIIEFQKQNVSLCTHPKFLEKDKLLKEHLEKYNKDLIYRKDVKFVRDKMAFNGKYAYKWPQQGGGKGKSNQGGKNKKGNSNKNKHTSDGDVRDGTDSDSPAVSYSSCLSQFSQPPNKGRGRQRGSRNKQTTGDNQNGGDRDKKIKEHLDDRHYHPSFVTANITRGDMPNNGVQILKGASGSDVLAGGNRTLICPSPSAFAHTNTPWNSGAIPKVAKDKDFQLFPPTQD